MNGILGKKIGMTRIVAENGNVIATTMIKCDPNVVTQIKTTEKDGYNAVVLAALPRKKATKVKKFHFLKEFKNVDGLEKGASIDLSIFKEGDEVKFTSTSKGKGFQGVVKRWNMAGGPGSHGSHFHREPGSVGARAKPGKIHPGKHLPGHMGNRSVTIKSTVVYIDLENNLLGVKGPVPGAINSLVTIRKIS